MKNILSIAAMLLILGSMVSCTSNTGDAFQSKVDLLVNDRLSAVKDSLKSSCDTNMETAIAARVQAAQSKRKAAASAPKSLAPATSTTTTTTTPVYVPPTTTTSTTTSAPKTSVESKRDKIQGKTQTGTVRTTTEGKTVQDAPNTGSKRDKIRGKIKRAVGGGN